MNPALPCVLTINGGSSSIRFAIYEVGETPRRLQQYSSLATSIGRTDRLHA
jgi:acetate kinase